MSNEGESARHWAVVRVGVRENLVREGRGLESFRQRESLEV